MSIEMCLLLACTHPTWSGFARILPLLQSLFLLLLEVMRLLLWELENQRFLKWAIGLLVSFWWWMMLVGQFQASPEAWRKSFSRFDSRKDMSIFSSRTNSELPSAVNLYIIYIHAFMDRHRSYRHQLEGCRLERLDFCAVRNALKIEPKVKDKKLLTIKPRTTVWLDIRSNTSWKKKRDGIEIETEWVTRSSRAKAPWKEETAFRDWLWNWLKERWWDVEKKRERKKSALGSRWKAWKTEKTSKSPFFVRLLVSFTFYSRSTTFDWKQITTSI